MSARSPRDLRLVGERCELPRHADRLGSDVDLAGVALVEQQIEHARHPRQIAWLIERNADEPLLRATDALRHRRLRHEEGIRDLPRRQAGDRTQRERDRRRRGEDRMRAQEVEPERVVTLRHGTGLGLVRKPLLAGQRAPHRCAPDRGTHATRP